MSGSESWQMAVMVETEGMEEKAEMAPAGLKVKMVTTEATVEMRHLEQTEAMAESSRSKSMRMTWTFSCSLGI